ncbi:plasmid mobilization relaxosome protein MobC [Hymenobacter humi]|uniref:Plasmid mobilization relaxosome protein MobC n=1 Tax=Hymenobacter humi TaxID=1411620 RepID=A0ABW2UAQ7_9BACT
MEASLPAEETPPKRKGGRPRNPVARPDRATVRFTKIEYLAVKRRAQAARLTVGDYCRQAVLTGQVLPTLDPAALPALHEPAGLGQHAESAGEEGPRGRGT